MGANFLIVKKQYLFIDVDNTNPWLSLYQTGKSVPPPKKDILSGVLQISIFVFINHIYI